MAHPKPLPVPKPLPIPKPKEPTIHYRPATRVQRSRSLNMPLNISPREEDQGPRHSTTDDLAPRYEHEKVVIPPVPLQFEDLPTALKNLCLNECKLSKEFCQQNARIIKFTGTWLYPELFPTIVTTPERTEKSTPEPRAERERAATFCSVDRISNAQKIIQVSDVPMKKKFDKGSQLGAGAFGSVYAAKEKITAVAPVVTTGPKKKEKKKKQKRPVAIKIVPHNTVDDHRANLSEIGFLSTLAHPNILTFYGAYLVTTTDKKKKSTMTDVWIVTEYLEGGTFSNAAGKMAPSNLQFLAHQILCALTYLHGQGIVHRDLKSPNVMISTSAQVKLIDFGLCRELDSRGKRNEICGSPCFIPPEMILQIPHGTPADIWSMGVCLLELLLGHPPHWKQPLKCMLLAATKGLTDLIPANVSNQFLSFLQECLVIDQDKRGLAADLQQHPWIKDLDLDVARKEMTPFLRFTKVRKRSSSFRSHSTMQRDFQGATPVIVDVGSHTMKIGFAGRNGPRAIFPTMVGTPKEGRTMVALPRSHYIGDLAQAERGYLTLSQPIQRGVVTDWEQFEAVLSFAWDCEMRIVPEEYPFFFTEPAFNPKSNREKLAKIMFETHRCPTMAIYNSGISALYASGRTTGVVLDIGDGVTQSIPIVSGFCITNAVKRQDFGGLDQTNYLKRIMTSRGYTFTTSAEHQIVCQIKEQLGYVALDFDAEMYEAKSSFKLDKSYELPDGQVITLGNERFRCGELLFRPALFGSEFQGIHEMVYSSVMGSDIESRKTLFGNIILSGGPTLSPGIDLRLSKEITSLATASTKVRVIVCPSRKYAVWIGASILASLSSFVDCWITHEEYEEIGPSVIHKKGFCID